MYEVACFLCILSSLILTELEVVTREVMLFSSTTAVPEGHQGKWGHKLTFGPLVSINISDKKEAAISHS